MYKVIAFLLIAIATANAAPIDSLKLRFRISARDLPDKDNIGKGDPYVEIFYTENDQKDEVKLGRTATLTDTANPDWGETFDFEFVRSKRQRFVLRVYDHDNLREDDKLGQAYFDASDFVDKNGHLNVNLNKKGYVILDTVDPFPTPSPAVITPQVQPVVVAPPAPISQTPITVAGGPVVYANTPQKLRFKLSAKNLPNKDKLDESDPFVIIEYTEGSSSKQTKIATSAVINDNNNPNWGEVFEFQYDPTKSQKWVFDLKDSDIADTDSLGKVWVEVSDYVAKGQKQTVNLSKQGTLTIESVDPIAPISATAPIQPAKVQPVTPKPVVVQPVAPPAPTAAPIVPANAPIKLKFRLSARGLEDRDVLGTSDPYVKVYYQEGADKEVLIGNTEKFDDRENVDWQKVFEYTYNPTLNSKFRFLVLDDDANRTDEELGDVSVSVSEYVKNGENLTLNLKKGTLQIIKAT